jgi:D-glycero-D-manno-heptose 1,7-bisphosphate phosphatase
MGDKIIEYFGDGRKLNVNIQYYKEKVPLGNAGALFKIRD